jgi:5-methylcytosine-specific restriction protein A
MALKDITRQAVLAAIAEYDRLMQTYFIDADPTSLLNRLGLAEPTGVSPLEMTFEARAAEYQHLCAGADVFWQNRDSRRAARTSSVPIRSDDARRAVLLRSEGRCENPGCAGDIHDVTDTGTPILEVDHIHDLAQGGDDNPAQMIALCPNCHAIKTRGRTREKLRSVLLTVALRRHQTLIGPVVGTVSQTGPHRGGRLLGPPEVPGAVIPPW